jgi:hypothetical protein
MDAQLVAAGLAKPIARELLGSSIPARLAYVGTDGDPRVIRVRALYKQMAVITIVPGWASCWTSRRRSRRP